MAKAKRIPVEVTSVILELTEQEASVLLGICDSIGGDPESSNRRYSNAVSNVLSKAGVIAVDCVGSIHF